VRRVFEQRFSVARMADDYERIYERIIGTAGKTAGSLSRGSWEMALLP
jgi:hypothetical protein